MLARQQGHLTHLMQIHPYGIIEEIQAPALGDLALFLHPLDLVNILGLDNIEIHPPQQLQIRLELFRIDDTFRDGFIDVLKRQIALVFG